MPHDDSVSELPKLDGQQGKKVSTLPQTRQADIINQARSALRDEMRNCIDAAIIATRSIYEGTPVNDEILIASVGAAGKRFFSTLDLNLGLVYDAGKTDIEG